MPKSAIIITIPKPCSENWEEMTVAERGRLCAACRKTVIDFSSLSDAEVVRVTKAESNGKELCGRYHHTQLGREMISYEPRYALGAGIIKKIAASLLLLQTALSSAQVERVHKPKTQHSKAIKNDEKSGEGRRIISGIVSDFITKKPLAGMLVQLEGTDIKAITNYAGKYLLPLPDTFGEKSVWIQAFYTEQSGEEPEGTVIPGEEINTDYELMRKNLSIYRYPSDTLHAVAIKAYKERLIDQEISGRYIMTGTSQTITVEKPNTHRSFLNKLFGKKPKAI